MGHRLTKIYTRTGDQGTTGLGNGQRIAKSHRRVAAMGTVDELNSVLGLLLCEQISDHIRDILQYVQHRLFDIGGELSIPGHCIITEQNIEQLEVWMDHMNRQLPPLKEFILPGGSQAAAMSHLARTVCRRAERCVIQLAEEKEALVSAHSMAYLNRLSDLLFVLSRQLNREHNVSDVFWQRT